MLFLCYSGTNPGMRLTGLCEEPRGTAVLYKWVSTEALQGAWCSSIISAKPTNSTMQIQDQPKLSAPGNIWLGFG